jgi:hypothetical protein
VHEELFAPWVKSMELTDVKVSHGKTSAVLRQSPDLQRANGAICGQVSKAAVDTAASLVMPSNLEGSLHMRKARSPLPLQVDSSPTQQVNLFFLTTAKEIKRGLFYVSYVL